MRSASADLEKLTEIETNEEHHTISLIEEPNLNNIQYVPFEGRFCRGQILSVDPMMGLCSAILIDHGNRVDDIPWQQMKKLRNVFRGAPKFTQLVTLDRVLNNEDDNLELQNYLSTIKNEILKVVSSVQDNKNQRIVRLMRSNGEIVNTKISQLSDM